MDSYIVKINEPENLLLKGGKSRWVLNMMNIF
jgi:hypothetical protein